ncbi:MAG TPA: methyltransferase domain-containing protein [Ktedonobacterales bacterium]|nr:methyltransferase domain-containing protein [Ktedonobacterales bacterium]
MFTPAYDQIAEWYDEQVRTGKLIHDLVLPALLAALGEVAGQRICDLACGQGVIARQLAQQGARVVGIDLSERLLALARSEEAAAPLHIIYQQDDAQQCQSLADASFDGVVCNMALMDIPDLAATVRAVQRILRPRGWFAFSITHPCIQMPDSQWNRRDDGTIIRESGNYFAEGFWMPAPGPGVRGRIGAHHRTLSTYLNSLVQAGFHIQSISEPRASGDLAQRFPGYRSLPAALVVYALKA